MILKGAQRGSAGQLARHLLNEQDNDFVEVHEVSGFLSDDVTGAFKEIQAIAKGTKCTQPFFTISINPPAGAKVTVDMFEDAADRIAKANGLDGQPRVIVFHEKNSRRHAHLVISRIDPKTMTAVNLPHFKNKLQYISRDLYFTHQWKLPAGLRDRTLKSPTNVTLAEWQAAKRRGKNAIDQKKLIQQCWASSDSKTDFEAALQDHGYILAKGDRRKSHVIVCHDGEVLAVSRATSLTAKVVRQRLGDAGHLQSVEVAMTQHANNIRRQFLRMAGEMRNEYSPKRADLNEQRKILIQNHRKERTALDKGQASRWSKESRQRAARFKTGLSGFWQSLSGQRRKITVQNSKETYQAIHRDNTQRQRLIDAQLKERNVIDLQRTSFRQQAIGLIQDMRSDRDRLTAALIAPNQKPTEFRATRTKTYQNQAVEFDPEP